MSQFKEKKGQSLPRHTLMAPIGKRITAFLVDAALTLLFTSKSQTCCAEEAGTVIIPTQILLSLI